MSAALPKGLSLILAVNLVQALAHWTAYRSGWVALLVLAGLTAASAVIWWRMTKGPGLATSALAVVAGPLALVTMATQLTTVELAGLANFATGFGVLPILFLPFARPAEEWLFGAAALFATQMFLLRGVGGDARDLHAVVLSAGAPVSIAIGTGLLVSIIRTTVEAGERVSEAAREAAWRRRVDDALATRLETRIDRIEEDAARLLEDIAGGLRSCEDAATVAASRQLAVALRAQLTSRSSPSLLHSYLAAADGGPRNELDRVDVTDDRNLSAGMGVDDRVRLVAAVRDAARWLTDGTVRVTILTGSTPKSAHIVIAGEGGSWPRTEVWRDAATRFGGSSTSVQADRWFYDFEVALRRHVWEAA